MTLNTGFVTRSHAHLLAEPRNFNSVGGRAAPIAEDGMTGIPAALVPTRNRLLAALPDQDFSRISPHLERVQLRQRDTLFGPTEPVHYVYFPETMVVSMVNTLGGNDTIEVGSVGSEGIAGLSVFLDDAESSMTGIVQIPGSACRIEAKAFSELAHHRGLFYQRLLRYTLVFLTQVAQTAACNASHLVEQRCARWLLMMHDRVGGSQFPLTHEFLAFMLGVGRPGVTVTMRGLQEAGLVRYTRGAVEITDRGGLERTSCGCYRAMRAELDRLLG